MCEFIFILTLTLTALIIRIKIFHLEPKISQILLPYRHHDKMHGMFVKLGHSPQRLFLVRIGSAVRSDIFRITMHF